LIEPWKKGIKDLLRILESIEREIVDVEKLEDGQYFGELIGESIYGNPYRIKGHL
jgi:hypothetical protein